MREIPFSLVQFPLYEYMKVTIISLQLLQETNAYLHLNDFFMARTYRIDVICYLNTQLLQHSPSHHDSVPHLCYFSSNCSSRERIGSMEMMHHCPLITISPLLM